MQKRNRVVIDNQVFWLSGQTAQDVFDKYLELCFDNGVAMRPGVTPPSQPSHTVNSPLFADYLQQFVDTFKSDQSSQTVFNRNHLIAKHIAPKFKDVRIHDITPMMIQEWFNDLGQQYSKEMVAKIKHTISPALDAAVEDGYIERNPAKSYRIKVTGKETVSHKAIPPEKMKEIRDGIMKIPGSRERFMTALLCTTGMRLEEVLGCRWEDFDWENGFVHVRRAVVHPKRNAPEVKDPKTKTSTRKIPIPPIMETWMRPSMLSGFVLHKGGDKETPLSYTETRKCISMIRDMFDIKEYSPHDFRDTCATEWREKGIPMDIISRMLGHSKTDVTEQRYVKYRDDLFGDIRDKIN